MASIKDELKAWKRLVEISKGKVAVLKKEYINYSEDSPSYTAYLADSGDDKKDFDWSPDFKSPEEAVDNRIACMEARDESNSS